MRFTSFIELRCGGCARKKYLTFQMGLLLKTMMSRLKKASTCPSCGSTDIHIMPHGKDD